jgi:hypothetical protein
MPEVLSCSAVFYWLWFNPGHIEDQHGGRASRLNDFGWKRDGYSSPAPDLVQSGGLNGPCCAPDGFSGPTAGDSLLSMKTRFCCCALMMLTLSGCVYVDATIPSPPTTVYYAPPSYDGWVYAPAPTDRNGQKPIPLAPQR